MLSLIKKENIIKKYEYSENKEIDRTGHTYIDYLAYIHKHPGCLCLATRFSWNN